MKKGQIKAFAKVIAKWINTEACLAKFSKMLAKASVKTALNQKTRRTLRPKPI